MDAKRKFLTEWMRSTAKVSYEHVDGTRAPESAPGAGDGSVALELAPAALVPFADADFWYLKEPLHWKAKSGKLEVTVPRGFTTDFATVPSVFWTWIPPVGRHGYPAVIHDWLYWEQTVKRRDADLAFDAALADLGVSSLKRVSMYQSVNWFGGRYWDDNAQAKKRGDKRVLKLFPTDATITWQDWRKRDGVFE